MRHYSLALLGLLALAAGAFAQQGAQPPPVGTPEQLNERLAGWEKAMIDVRSILAKVSRTDVNKVRGQNTVKSGEVRCLKVDAGNGKVDKLALLYLAEKDDPKSYEKYICTGDLLYSFSPREQTLYVRKLPNKLTDDSFLGFLFEMKAEALKKRFDMTLVRPDDPNYVYIDIKPRLEADKAEFERARLVLFRRDFLPAQLWFQEPTTGVHHTWDLSELKINDPGVKATDFVAPEKPAGWKVEEVKDKQPEPPPRVIRQNGK
jgi:TIGR03009 family protein